MEKKLEQKDTEIASLARSLKELRSTVEQLELLVQEKNQAILFLEQKLDVTDRIGVN